MFQGQETPVGSKIFQNKLGQYCRLSGNRLKNGIWYATIFIYDTQKFVEKEFNLIEKYLK